jgi:hypothetical protein
VVQAVYNSGTVAAALSCYGLDAGVADTGTRTVTLRGLVLSANGEPTGRSIGSQLKLYRAADFIVSDTPAPLATSSVFDGGVSGTGDAGPAPAGTYTLDNVPVNEDLVISVSGGTGLMPTHQFVTVAIDAASTVDFQLVAYDQDLWDAVAKSANITPGATRAGVVGQVQDCSPQPRRILGATVALDTPSHVFYSDPMYFVVDPGATVTSRTGRYFFFDVPAMPINVVTALRTSATEVVYLDHRARTLPASITVVTLRPPVKNP